MTVTTSHTSSTSLRKCETSTTATPLAARARITSWTLAASWTERLDRGSSKITIRAFLATARRISVFWRSDWDSVETKAAGSRSKPESSINCRARRSISPLSQTPRRLGNWPSSTFSATVSPETSDSSWATIVTPASSAARGDANDAREPSTSMCPLSGLSAPHSILARVVLPAPFWPTRPWICPRLKEMSAESTPRTPPNVLVSPKALRNASSVRSSVRLRSGGPSGWAARSPTALRSRRSRLRSPSRWERA